MRIFQLVNLDLLMFIAWLVLGWIRSTKKNHFRLAIIIFGTCNFHEIF